MIVLSFIFVVIATILIICYWFQTRSRVAKLLNQFPLVAPITPVLGNVELLSSEKDVLFNQIRKYSAKHKETYAGWGGIVPTLHIITPDDAEIILSNINYIKKGMVYYSLRSWLGTGLLTSTGEKWHHRRKMLTPAFHYNILKVYVEVFGKQSHRLIDKLKGECNGTEINIIPLIKESTLHTICETAMGVQLDKNLNDYFEALHSLTNILIKMIISPWFHPQFKLYYFSKLYWQKKDLVTKLHRFTTNVIKKRQETFEDSDVTNLELGEGKPRRNLAMLDLLIFAKRQLGEIDDEGIREEVDTFVFEGHDTISSGSTFALFLLAHHKNIQQKVIDELDEIFDGSSRLATYEDFQNMRYLERCLKECQRLYPSVPLIVRSLKEDTSLTHHVAPAGTELFIHIYDIHRDPEYFPDPEKFDPDRFLPERSKGRHPYVYVPFSAGPRNCIGQRFAVLEMKNIISTVLRNYTLDAVDRPEDLTLMADLVLRSKGPVYIKFKPNA